jgi:metallo-beta-lactamase family protein
MQVSFHGAAGTVTGSRHLLEAHGRKILLDCGLFQGLKALRERNWLPPGFDCASIDAVILSHAHLDHSGWIPLLVKSGFTGPIYTTEAARDLAEVLLVDSGHLQEEDARFANRHGFSKHNPALPLYTEEEARTAMAQFHVVAWQEPFDLGGGMTATLHRAGHMLGASTVRVTDGKTTVVYTGDLGRPNDLLLPDPEVLHDADFILCESTYGNREHDGGNREHGGGNPEPDLAAIVKRTAGRGGALIIPSFTVGRAQQMLWHFRRLRDRGEIPDIPIYLDSPMAATATELYNKHKELLRLTPAECKAMCETPRVIHTVEESKQVTAWQGPMIVIAGSGMATGGRVLHHIKAFAPDHRNTFLFAGYQSVGTRGADMVAGKKMVRIHGTEVTIRAEVVQLESISAHADWPEIIQWLRGFTKPPKQLVIVHGEPDAAAGLAEHVKKSLHWPTHIAVDGETLGFSGEK